MWTVTCTPRIAALRRVFEFQAPVGVYPTGGRVGSGVGAPITTPRVRQPGRKLAMPGIAELALGAAPIAGGALLGAAAGSFKGPDVRAMIAKDMDLLERIPDDQPELKARLKASIDERINDLIAATEKTREIRRMPQLPTGQLARHRGVHLCDSLHHHLVERQPQPVQLADHVHRDDRAVGPRGPSTRAAASARAVATLQALHDATSDPPRLSSGRCPTGRGCARGRRRRRTPMSRSRRHGPDRGSCSRGRCVAGLSRCGSRRRRARTRRKTLWPS